MGATVGAQSELIGLGVRAGGRARVRPVTGVSDVFFAKDDTNII
jgi:hypothetical protein